MLSACDHSVMKHALYKFLSYQVIVINYCQRLMILRINKVNLISVYSLPQKGEGRKGQKERHSLLEITNKEREKIL